LSSAIPQIPSLGLGIGWRPPIALAVDRRTDLGFVEIVAENVSAEAPDPALCLLRERGVQIIPHGISLSLGGAQRPDPHRLRRIAELAKRFDSPLVSEHIAFVRAGDAEAGHLLPVSRSRQSLQILGENIKIAAESLPVPLALENISTLFEWPDAEMDEAEFISRAIEDSNVLLLLDVANIHANARNLGWDPNQFLDALPLQRLAYVHVGGGSETHGVYHDTHADAIPPQALDILNRLAMKVRVPGAMLERDDNFPSDAEVQRELDAIKQAMTGNREIPAQ
jgi:uncharacterized protein (UPF0276 family)